MTGELVPVTRPNGKVYRPKKPPVAIVCEPDPDDWRHDRQYVYVMRTHDVERARVLAQHLINVYPNPVEVTWVREGMRGGERFFFPNDVRGVPCVVFRTDD